MDCLSTGASLLLPPLTGRLNILKSLLAQDTNLTIGQVIFIIYIINMHQFVLVLIFYFSETAFRCHSF